MLIHIIERIPVNDLFFFVSSCKMLWELYKSNVQKNQPLATSVKACYISVSRTIWMGHNLRGPGYGKGYGRNGKKKGYGFHPYMFSEAASCGKVDVLKWLNDKKCPKSRHALYSALKNGHIDATLWLLDNGCSPDLNCWYEVGRSGSVELYHIFSLKYPCRQASRELTELVQGLTKTKDGYDLYMTLLVKIPYVSQHESELLNIDNLIQFDSIRLVEYCLDNPDFSMERIDVYIELCNLWNRHDILRLFIKAKPLETRRHVRSITIERLSLEIPEGIFRDLLGTGVQVEFRDIYGICAHRGFLDILEERGRSETSQDRAEMFYDDMMSYTFHWNDHPRPIEIFKYTYNFCKSCKNISDNRMDSLERRLVTFFFERGYVEHLNWCLERKFAYDSMALLELTDHNTYFRIGLLVKYDLMDWRTMRLKDIDNVVYYLVKERKDDIIRELEREHNDIFKLIVGTYKLDSNILDHFRDIGCDLLTAL